MLSQIDVEKHIVSWIVSQSLGTMDNPLTGLLDESDVAAPTSSTDTPDDGLHAKHLLAVHRDAIDSLHALNLRGLNRKVLALCRNAAEAADMHRASGASGDGSTRSSKTAAIRAQMVKQLAPFMDQFVGLCDRLLVEFLGLHKAVCKLSLILSGLFTDILKRGFCGPVEEQEGEAGDETGDLDGTGMADGHGKNDVSEQIEDEEQVLGNKDDEPTDETGEEIPEEDHGIEMANEFDGEMFDVEKDEQKEDDEDSDNDEFDEDDLDQQMGETNPDEADVTEDQQLAESDNEDQDEQEEGGDGGTGNNETELSAKQDDGGPTDDSKGDNAKDEQVEDQQQEQEQEQEQQDDDSNESKVNDDYKETEATAEEDDDDGAKGDEQNAKKQDEEFARMTKTNSRRMMLMQTHPTLTNLVLKKKTAMTTTWMMMKTTAMRNKKG